MKSGQGYCIAFIPSQENQLLSRALTPMVVLHDPYSSWIMYEWLLPIFLYGCAHYLACPECYAAFDKKVSRPMMTSSNGNIFRVTGPLCGEFTGAGEFPTRRLVTRSFRVFFDLRLNERLSKQQWGWWYETPSWSLWRQCNAILAL